MATGQSAAVSSSEGTSTSVKLFQGLGWNTDNQENFKKCVYALKKKSTDFFDEPKGMGCAIEFRSSEFSGFYIVTSDEAVSTSWVESKHLSAERYCSKYPDHLRNDDHETEIKLSSSSHKKTEGFVFFAIEEPKHFLICDYNKINSISVLNKPLLAFTFVAKQFVQVTFVKSNEILGYECTEVIPSTAKNYLSTDKLIGAPVVVQDSDGSLIVIGVLGGRECIRPVLFGNLQFEVLPQEAVESSDTTDSPIEANRSDLGAKQLQDRISVHENVDSKADSSLFHNHCIRDRNIMNNLPKHIWTTLYIKLDPIRLEGDYQALAEKLGYDMEMINFFAQKNCPTEFLLVSWCRKPGQGTIRQLYDALRSIGRDDAIEVIDDWFKKQGCNCENCGSLT